MKRTSFPVYVLKLFFSSVFGVFLCFCIDVILGITEPNFFQSLFMAVVYIFMYSIFPYYVSIQQADRDRKILRYKENFPEEVPYTLKQLDQPKKGLYAGLIVMIPHFITLILPLFHYFGLIENYNHVFVFLNMHLREFINLLIPAGQKGTWFGMLLLIVYQLFLPAVAHFGYTVSFKEIPIMKKILYKKKEKKQ